MPSPAALRGHGGGANRSNGARVGVLLGYSPGWPRREENQDLTVPPRSPAPCPRRLIGDDLRGEHLGWIDEGDPHIVLEDDADPGARVFRAPAARASPARTGGCNAFS